MSIIEEQRKLAEERFEVASERYTLETMLKLDTGTGTNLIQAKLEVKEGFKELKKKENEVEKRLELAKELEKRLTEEKCNLQERDDEIKLKSIRAEKMLKVNPHFTDNSVAQIRIISKYYTPPTIIQVRTTKDRRRYYLLQVLGKYPEYKYNEYKNKYNEYKYTAKFNNSRIKIDNT